MPRLSSSSLRCLGLATAHHARSRRTLTPQRPCLCSIIAAVARQHLLPPVLAFVHPRFGTPWVATLLQGVATAVIALFTGVCVCVCFVCASCVLRVCCARAVRVL
jgi:hypothetical protein